MGIVVYVNEVVIGEKLTANRRVSPNPSLVSQKQ